MERMGARDLVSLFMTERTWYDANDEVVCVYEMARKPVCTEMTTKPRASTSTTVDEDTMASGPVAEPSARQLSAAVAPLSWLGRSIPP